MTGTTTFKREPWHLTGRECAAYLKIAPSTFSERGHAPVAVEGNSKLYDIREIVQSDRPKNGVFVDSDGVEFDHEVEKAKWTQARRIAQDLANEERLAELAPPAVMAAQYRADLDALCGLLDRVPGVIREAWPDAPEAVFERVGSRVHAMRSDFAKREIRF